MIEIVELLFLILLIFLCYKLIRFITKRVGFMRCVSRLKRSCGARVKYSYLPFLPPPFKRARISARVEIGNTVYLIRLYNGGGFSKSVHFASEEYSVIYTKLKTTLRSPRKIPKGQAIMNVGLSAHGRVRCLSPLPKITESGKTVVPVILFNPAPAEVSYVTESRTSISLAFTGDELYGSKVFTASTFFTYAERRYRAEKMQNPECKINFN